jgi:hypothetical protein
MKKLKSGNSKKNNFTSLKNKCFKILDIYYSEIPLRFKGEKEYITLLDIIMSIFSLLTFIILTFCYLEEFWKRKNYSIISNTQYSLNESINLTNIPIFFNLLGSNFKFLKNKIDYEVMITYEKYNPLNISHEHINVKKCNVSDYMKEHPNVIIENFYFFEDCYCIDTSNKEILLYGKDENNQSSSLTIHLLKCVNTSENNNCVNSEISEKMLLNSYLFFGYFEENINNYNYLNPISQYFKYENIHFTTSVVKSYNYKFQKVNYISDDGIIFNKFRYFSLFNFIDLSLDISFKDNIFAIDENIFGKIIFSHNNQVLEIKRIYSKITEVIAILQAIMKITYIFCEIFISFFSQKLLKVDIFNSIIFDFDKKKNLNFNWSVKSNEFKNLMLNRNNNDNKSNSLIRFIRKEKLIEINHLKKNSSFEAEKIKTNKPNYLNVINNKIILQFHQFFIPLFMQKKNKNILLLENTCEKIYKTISIENIYKKLEKNSLIYKGNDLNLNKLN